MAPFALLALVDAAEPVETIFTMERAAENRLFDALAISNERPNEALSCAYMLGYVVECTLKAALGRLGGLSLADDLRPALRGASLGNGHDLRRILDACLVNRTLTLPALSANDESIWRVRVDSVANSCNFVFRYKSYPVPAVALAGTYGDVEWIVDHAHELWT